MKLNIDHGQTAAFIPSSLLVPDEDVVEIGLLLPAKRASALMQLAQDRHQSVGQILRSLIEQELARSA